MKKQNEGYVLAMVMVVIAVLAIVASTMLGIGLRNVQTQKVAIVRMESKYKAEGAVEIIVAEFGEVKTEDATTENDAKTKYAANLDAIYMKYNPNSSDGGSDPMVKNPELTLLSTEEEKSNGIYKYRIVATGEIEEETNVEPMVVMCEIELVRKITSQVTGEITKYTASVDMIKYNKYETSTTIEGGFDT